MEIKSTYVTFEQAKLLFEKNFNEYCTSYYEKDKSLHQYVGNFNSEDLYMPHYSRPEQWKVVEWLRVNHGIWIEVCKPARQKLFRFNVDINDQNVFTSVVSFQSPQEAYSAAFDYVLKNLI